MTEQYGSVAANLPVIDISPMQGGSIGDKAAMAATLRDACERSGFFYVSGHGIEPALIEQVFAASKRFFELPMTDKLAVDKAQSKANRGYEPLRGQTLEAGAPPDLKEGFYIEIGRAHV